MDNLDEDVAMLLLARIIDNRARFMATVSVGQCLVHLVNFSELHCFSAINCLQLVGSPTLSAVQCKKIGTEKHSVQCSAT
jgi:hypothetical protein